MKERVSEVRKTNKQSEQAKRKEMAEELHQSGDRERLTRKMIVDDLLL